MTSTMGVETSDPDMILIGELLEDISRHPPAIHSRKILVQHYISCGWLDAALENAHGLNKLNPKDPEVAAFIAELSQKPKPPPAPAPAPAESSSQNISNELSRITHPEKRSLVERYVKLRSKGQSLLSGLSDLQALQKKNGLPQSKNTEDVQAIADGESARVVANTRSVTRTIRSNPEQANELAIQDLEDYMRWLRERYNDSPGVDNDWIREALAKRVHAVESALPENLKCHPEIAFMHVQHEHLGKEYVNKHTMLWDEVKDIARENFFVTEDNYAWDMEELAAAITANGGVMRNPVSKDMFTTKDIQGILKHPAGSKLAAMQVEQHEMAQGVRPDTITRMEKLARVLLEEQKSDNVPSRHAVDEFMAYIATLPELEQKALYGLRCPAQDSHTGKPYDFSIGEAVRDAKGNLVCFHKTGEFIQQAAAYLRRNPGAPPDGIRKKKAECVVM